MPRFVPNGPFVPDRLVQELEDDRVVIFCGAGISMGAGLPSYAGLVSHCYTELGEALPPDKSPEWVWPDRMLGSLESRYGAEEVRRVTAERLDVVPSDLTIHEAILRLARLKRTDGFRLVTTNFDRFFEQARAGLQLGRDFHSGPVLPIPRNDHISSWKTLVYLHGRLEDVAQGNQHLVLTSADFGRAYLTEAWAARFVARLFADFTVLFIGYSLNDPVLRYMTDAFAAEDALSRSAQPRGPAYIFVPHTKSPPDRRAWQDRRLEPIFYNQTHRHIRLTRTLAAWADARQDYLSNTRVMINRFARTPPEALDPSSSANLIWAIAGRPDDTGQGAAIFAKLAPPPPIEWLFELERRDQDARVRHAEAVAEAERADRPVPLEPIAHIRPMFPPSMDNRGGGLSGTGQALLPWLLQYLGDVRLVEWVIAKLKAGCRAHPLFRYQVRRKLAEQLELPAGYQRFWRIVSAEGDWGSNTLRRFPPWDLRDSLRSDRDAPWVRLELAAAMRPWLGLERSLYRTWRAAEGSESAGAPAEGTRLAHIAEANVHLADEENIKALIKVVETTPEPDAYWASQLDLLVGRLREVFDLYAVAGVANREADPSSFQRPSIIPHPQNHNHQCWARLFDLIWRGWSHVDALDAATSRRHVAQWQQIPYQGFRRLVLAAMAHSNHFTAAERLEALLNG